MVKELATLSSMRLGLLATRCPNSASYMALGWLGGPAPILVCNGEVLHGIEEWTNHRLNTISGSCSVLDP